MLKYLNTWNSYIRYIFSLGPSPRSTHTHVMYALRSVIQSNRSLHIKCGNGKAVSSVVSFFKKRNYEVMQGHVYRFIIPFSRFSKNRKAKLWSDTRTYLHVWIRDLVRRLCDKWNEFVFTEYSLITVRLNLRTSAEWMTSISEISRNLTNTGLYFGFRQRTNWSTTIVKGRPFFIYTIFVLIVVWLLVVVLRLQK
jgi:hypothetical protein